MSGAVVKPINQKEYTSRQSRFKHLPEAGRSNGLLIAPSFVGKTTWIQSWLLDWYRGLYSRIYVFSPNALTDEWKPIRDYCEKSLGVDLAKEQCFFEDMDEAALNDIIQTQFAVVQELKRQNQTQMYQVCVILDDLASEPKFHKNYGPLSVLFTRGRHAYIQTICSSQKWKLISPTARVNAHWIACFRLRNKQDLEAFLSELTAIYPYETLLELYEKAVGDQQYSFLFVDLKAQPPKFYLRFDHLMVPSTPGARQLSDGDALRV
jgi:hypothetical protein